VCSKIPVPAMGEGFGGPEVPGGRSFLLEAGRELGAHLARRRRRTERLSRPAAARLVHEITAAAVSAKGAGAAAPVYRSGDEFVRVPHREALERAYHTPCGRDAGRSRRRWLAQN